MKSSDAGDAVKQIALLCILGLVVPAASADWSPLGSNSESNISIDRSTIRSTPQGTRVWTLWDHFAPKIRAGKTYRSQVYEELIDCEQRRRAVIAIRLHADARGEGSTISSIDVPGDRIQFSAIAPGSVADGIANAVCVKQPTLDQPEVSAALSRGLEGAVVFRMVSESIAIIKTDAGVQGSAVALASLQGSTSFATNCHVLAGATRFTIATKRTHAEGHFLAGDPKYDTCTVFAEVSVPAVPDTFNALDLLPGEKVFAIGAPRGLELSISEGIVSARRGDPLFQPPVLIQTTAPISPGSSGGGLFDARGRLVGITSFLLKDAQNLNFAIAIHEYNRVHMKPKVRTLEELNHALREAEAARKIGK